MQTPQKENKKKTKISSPGNNPEVLNPQVLSPHNIEREILLKQIESLQYQVREQKRSIDKLTYKLQLAKKQFEWSMDDLTLANSIVEQQQRVAITHQNCYKDLYNAWLGSTRNCKRLTEINDYLLKGVELQPAVKKIIEAKKLPLHLN